MQNFVGMLEYLSSWRWDSPGIVKAHGGTLVSAKALPMRVGDAGGVEELGECAEGGAVFDSDRQAVEYLLRLLFGL